MNESLQELLKYLKLIYRRRYVFIGVSMLVMTIMIGWSYSQPKQYRAACTFFVQSNVINSLVEGLAVTPKMDEKIRVLKYALSSRGLLERVLQQMNHKIFSKGQQKIESYINGLVKRIEIEVRRNELFVVAIVDSDPVFARDFVNLLVASYIEESLNENREETYGAKLFLDEQIAYFRGNLEASENAIIDFRKKQNVYVTVNEENVIKDLRDYQREVEKNDISLSTLIAQKAQYKEQLKKVPAAIPLFNEQDQDARVLTLEKKVRQLLLTFTENYPEVIRLKAEIRSLKKARRGGQTETAAASSEMSVVNPVYQDIQQKIFDLEAQISSLKSQNQHLTQILNDREKILRDIPESQKNLSVLIQERDSNRRVYEELLMRQSQSDVSKQMEIGDKTTNFRIVDAAFLPKVPTSPNILLLVLMSIAGGLGVGSGSVVLFEKYRDTLVDIEQLQDFDVAILTTIPTINNPQQIQMIRQRDKIVFTISSIYLAGIIGILLRELYKRFF